MIVCYSTPCLHWSINHGYRLMVHVLTVYEITYIYRLCNHYRLDTKLSQDKSEKNKWTKLKCGCKGGICLRLKRLKNKPPLPTSLLINVQSLRVKATGMSANIYCLQEYGSACVLALMEMWLEGKIASSEVEPAGFRVFRIDRDPIITRKARGGCVRLLIRNDRCRAVAVSERLCTLDIELLCASLQPFSLPREGPNIFFTAVHIYRKPNFKKALEILHHSVTWT